MGGGPKPGRASFSVKLGGASPRAEPPRRYLPRHLFRHIVSINPKESCGLVDSSSFQQLVGWRAHSEAVSQDRRSDGD